MWERERDRARERETEWGTKERSAEVVLEEQMKRQRDLAVSLIQEG